MQIGDPVQKIGTNNCIGIIKGFDKESDKKTGKEIELLLVSFLDNKPVFRVKAEYERFTYWFEKKRGL